MSNRISPAIALVAFAIAAMILAQGITAPFVKDAEPQAAGWIQDVASGENILLPRDWYGELARKPPLFYWMAGAIAAVSGGRVDEVRARIVSVFAGAAIAVLVLRWASATLGETTGWLAFLFLLGSFGFTSRGTLALEDMLLAAFMFAAWCRLYLMLERGASHRDVIAIGVLLGLGVLTKGPIAIVLPAFGILIYLLTMRQSIVTLLTQGWPWMAGAIAIAIGSLWYVPALMSYGGDLARIMFAENAGHFLPASAGGTGEAARPFYYIAMRMVGGITPLNFLLPALVVAWIGGEFVAEARKPLMFQLSFLLAMLVFFSVASAKRDDYVLPGIPSLAILLAALFTSLQPSRLAGRLRDLAVALVAVISIAGLVTTSIWISTRRIALLAGLNPVDRAQAELFVKYYVGALSIMFVTLSFALASCCALIFSGLKRGHPLRIGVGIGFLSLVGVLMFTAILRPETSRDRTLKYAAADINRMAPNEPIYVIGENQELSFYLHRRAPQMLGPHRELRTLDQPAYLFAYKSDFQGKAAPLRERATLLKQWDRVGKYGSPALYRLAPDGLKPSTPQGR